MTIGSEVWIGSGFACLNPGVEKEGRLVDARALEADDDIAGLNLGPDLVLDGGMYVCGELRIFFSLSLRSSARLFFVFLGTDMEEIGRAHV